MDDEKEKQDRTLTDADADAVAVAVIKRLRGGLIFGLGLGVWELIKRGLLICLLGVALYGATHK